MSATKIGINCRNTAGYVTDGADQTYWLGEAYPVVRAGWTFGETLNGGRSGGDTTTSGDVRLAGYVYNGSTGTTFNLRVDLPAAGAYKVRLAMGNQLLGLADNKVVIKDGSTPLLTIGPHSYSVGNYYDAADALLSAANWPGSNTQATLTFSGTVMNVEVSSPTDFATLAHLEIEQVVASADPFIARLGAQMVRGR